MPSFPCGLDLVHRLLACIFIKNITQRGILQHQMNSNNWLNDPSYRFFVDEMFVCLLIL